MLKEFDFDFSLNFNEIIDILTVYKMWFIKPHFVPRY